MKLYGVLMLCCVSFLNSAEKYPADKKIHNIFIDILTTNGIKIAGKHILHVTTEKDFTHHHFYDVALAAFSFNCFKDQSQMLTKIRDSLKQGGEFFFTIQTLENPEPLNLIAAKEILSKPMGSLLKCAHESLTKDPSKALGVNYPKTQDLRIMLQQTGFEILLCKEQSCDIVFKNRKEIEDYQRPIIMNRPIMKDIPDILHTSLFPNFIDLLSDYMTKTDKLEFIEKIITTVVHVRKK